MAEINNGSEGAFAASDKPLGLDDPLDLSNVVRRHAAATVQVAVKSFAVGASESPPKTFIRAHADVAFTLETFIVPRNDDASIERAHLVTDPEIADELLECGLLRPALLTRIVTRQGEEKLWIVKRPMPGATEMVSHSTSLECLAVVREQWGRVRWASRDEGYVVEVPLIELPDPKWQGADRVPAEVMQELVKKAFRTNYIADRDHAVYQALATAGRR